MLARFKKPNPRRSIALTVVASALVGVVKVEVTRAAAPKSRPSGADEMAMKNAAQAMLSDIALSKLGCDRAKQPEIRAFVAMALSESSKLAAVIQVLAELLVTSLPTDLTAAQQETLAHLAERFDFSYDKAYLDVVIRPRKGESITFGMASKSASDAEVRTVSERIAQGATIQLVSVQGLLVMQTPDTSGSSARP